MAAEGAVHTCGVTLPRLPGWGAAPSSSTWGRQDRAEQAWLTPGMNKPGQRRAGGFSAPSKLHLPTHRCSAFAKGCSGAAPVLRGAALERRGLARERLCRRQSEDCGGIWDAARRWRRLQASRRRRWHKVPEPRVGRTSPRDRAGSGRTGKSPIPNADKSRELFLSEKISH